MELHNNPNLGTDLLEIKVRQLEDKIKELTQTVGDVQGNVDNLSNRVTTANLEAENAEVENLTVSDTLTTNAMVMGSSLEVSEATIGEVSATSISTEETDSAVSHIGEADGESLELSGNFHSAGAKVDNLINATPIGTTQYVGYDSNGNLIPVDPTIGVAKWENTARSNTIQPVENANVTIPNALNLPDRDSESMSDTKVLALNTAGDVVEVDLLDLMQKKLTAGYNISISDNGTISCDITVMNLKGSVDTYEDLPTTGNVKGDVWNVVSTSQNYCWNGSAWFVVGSSVDLSNYYTKEEVYAKSETYAKTDVYTKTQTETSFVNRTFGTCSSSADAQSKTVSIPAITTLNAGCEIKVLFTNGNTSGSCAGTSSNKITLADAPTLQLNSFNAYPIKIGGEYAGEGFIQAGDVHTFVFDGSAWNDMTSDVIYQGSTSAGNYVKKRNGFITEWGTKPVTAKIMVNALPIAYTETTYSISLTKICTDSDTNTLLILNKTNTTFTTEHTNPHTSYEKLTYIDWFATGF